MPLADPFDTQPTIGPLDQSQSETQASTRGEFEQDRVGGLYCLLELIGEGGMGAV